MHGATCGGRRTARQLQAACIQARLTVLLNLPASRSPCPADVTSSNPSIGGVLTGLGIAPNKLGAVIGVVSIAGWCCCFHSTQCAEVVGMRCWLGIAPTELGAGIGMVSCSWR